MNLFLFVYFKSVSILGHVLQFEYTIIIIISAHTMLCIGDIHKNSIQHHFTWCIIHNCFVFAVFSYFVTITYHEVRSAIPKWLCFWYIISVPDLILALWFIDFACLTCPFDWMMLTLNLGYSAIIKPYFSVTPLILLQAIILFRNISLLYHICYIYITCNKGKSIAWSHQKKH